LLRIAIMATLLSSEAFFKERALECGLSEQQFQILKDKNLSCARSFAFAISREGNEEDLKELAKIFVSPPEVPGVGLLSILRGLHFESYTLFVADWRSRVEKSDRDEAPRRLPLAERNSRRAAQVARLPGVRLEGVTDPGHRLIDLFESMCDQNVLTYVPWDKCISRESELEGTKVVQTLKVGSAGALEIVDKGEGPSAYVADGLSVRQALTRRGLAMDQCGLLDFRIHEQWSDLLMSHLAKLPLPGFQPVTLEQLRRADVALFSRAAELTRDGIRRKVGGDRPLDAAFSKASDGAQTLMCLLPLASPAVPMSRSFPPRDRSRSPRGASGKGSSKGKGKHGGGKGGKGRKQNSGIRIPDFMVGKAVQDDKGNKLCFNYQVKSCTNRVTRNGAGLSCDRGLHVCAAKGCFKEHPACEHP
jgi:hypothetical protein